VMWSEHCSYKTSRLHLKKLPTSAPWVIQGPGENAGVVDIGDGQAAIFKMESHNHPSYIEPYQGAATGVGGIMRDVFTMGARPVANLNALRFGEPSHPKTRHLISGVVAGIAGYGNCMGVPTVGGETQFDKSYNGNILVNAMTVGIADQDNIFYARGAVPGQPVVYVGSKTGRDGIHGATMASAEFDDAAEEKRPTVQVGDPFTEKLLLEACLELMQKDVIVSIQDMGAAGLTSSSVEIADKGGIGVHLDLDQVPQREPLMTPYEIMLSESQERMLMILKPGREDEARAIFEKWDLDFAVIGTTTAERTLKLDMYGKTWCNIPVPPLVDDAPVYDRPVKEYTLPKCAMLDKISQEASSSPDRVLADLKSLMESPDMASKRWIWEQYDSLVMGNTKASSGIARTQSGRAADAAVVKVGSSEKALALSSDCNPHYCYANPYEGGKQVVAESYRNLCATGAKPLAVTNNLNFGNPERPEIMFQLVKCLEGMAEACRTLDYPIVSGNVSLYNETNGKGILPTPVIGGVGLIADMRYSMDMAFKGDGETLFLIGADAQDDTGHLGQSLYLRERYHLREQEAGLPPSVNLQQEKHHGSFVRELIETNMISACHDVSDGGILCALAEMALAGETGCTVSVHRSAPFWFGEDQARYLVTTNNPLKLKEKMSKDNIPFAELGQTGGQSLNLPHCAPLSLADLRSWHEGWLKAYME
ncbi:MAG: phosphoribosylformylglycinamidine synthase subunit PurL, partial [Rhodospirillales bacterium]|nr:phosphoribosylformylglycinamidine synthase subunit PurL [Rhodospirillales bacterium]